MRGLQPRALLLGDECVVEPTGVEPVSRLCESRIFPLEHGPRATHAGIEPEKHGRQPRRDTSHYMGRNDRAREGNRTLLALGDNQRTSPDVSTSMCGTHRVSKGRLDSNQ